MGLRREKFPGPTGGADTPLILAMGWGSLMPTHLWLLPGLLGPMPQAPFLAPESGRV